MNIKDSLLAAMVLSIWGVNFYVMRMALLEISPMVLGALRFTLLVFPAVFFVKRPNVKWYWLLAYGLTISFLQFSFTFSAIASGMPTGLAALLLQAQVFFTVLGVAWVWHEKVQINHLMAMLMAAVGLFLIGVGQYTGSLPMWGLILMLGAAASWAVGNLILKKIGRVNPISLVVWGNVFTVIPFALVALWQDGLTDVMTQISNLSPIGWLMVCFLAYFASLCGYAGWGGLLSRYPAGKVTPLALFVPVIALLLAWAVLNEPLNQWHWCGIVVVLLALLMQVFGARWVNKLFHS